MSLAQMNPPYLLSLVMVIIAAAAYMLVSRIGKKPLRRAIVKTAPVALLAALSVPWGAHWLITVGLAASALGDWLLVWADEEAENAQNAFLGGLISFLTAHIIYTIAFFGVADLSNLAAMPGLLAPMGCLAISAVMGPILWRKAGPLRLPVMGYIVAIVAMALSAWATGNLLIGLGATAFMASDLILAIERFILPPDDPRKSITGPALWVLYVLAQILILTGAMTSVIVEA